MTKLKKVLPAGLLMAGVLGAWGAAADRFVVPAPDADGVRGATMPYTRYDCNEAGDAELTGGAAIMTAPDWNPANKATQASHQAYVAMPVGSQVNWNMKTAGNGVTIRYTIADKNAGSMGYADGWKSEEGKLDIYVNDQYDTSVPLTSYHMYQYFNFGSGTPNRGQANGDVAAFAFDEKHVKLNHMLKPGDRIGVKCVSGTEVGVDFLEIEVVPEPLEAADVAGGRQVFDVTNYGASLQSKDNRGAFNAAIAAANKVGGVVYIPEGTWLMGYNAPNDLENQQGLWSLNGKDIMITGAGMWYTNIQFTGWGRFGGGISGGNPSNTGSNVNDNVEFCNVYVNSNLCDRYGENAVAKGFMDIWCSGSVFHDVWVEHFECGFWLGDYNDGNNSRSSDGLRITDCRIRNNFADGVNFCIGTSNSAVYNCSVRNNGDDGLANWNNSEYGAKDEANNIFAYNTIDLIWRAGAIALYGGINQKAYNNYICDTFMASGIHLNTTFSGYKFENTTADKPILFENNWLVRSGTLRECWGRNYAAIDLEGACRNVVFRNNHIWDSPAEAIRIMNDMEGIIFDGLYVNGSGLSNGRITYSGWNYNPAAGCLPHAGGSVTWKNFQIVEGSVAQPDMSTGWKSQQHWPFWDNEPASWSWVNEDDIDWSEAPDYPDARGIEPPVNIFDTLHDYDVTLTGIDWITQAGKHSMYDGDRVTLRVRIDNIGSTSIPSENAKFAVRFTIDGKDTYSYTVKEGLAGGDHLIIEFPTVWNAVKGAHVFTAEVDPAGKMTYETNRSNNIRTKEVNVNEPEEEVTEPEIVTGSGSDVGVVKVYFVNLTDDNDEIKVGDELEPHAVVANYGSTSITLGSGKGFLWGFDGKAEYMSGMLWNDDTHVIKPGEWIDITPNGGGNQTTGGWTTNNTYIVKAGNVSLFGRMDNPESHNDNNPANNSASADYVFPTSKPEYNPNPDRADNLDNGGFWDYEDEENEDDPIVTTGYDLIPVALEWKPNSREITYGEEINNFVVAVKNESNVDMPAGKTVRVSVTIDGKTVGTATCNDFIAAGSGVTLEITGNVKPEPGGHTLTAVVSKVNGELSYDNNSRERTLNVIGDSNFDEPDTEYVTNFSEAQVQGRSLVIRRVFWHHAVQTRSADGIRPGHEVRFSAEVYNNGTEPTVADKHGLLFETMPSYDPKYWADNHKTSIAPGESAIITTCGGTNDNQGIWGAQQGTTLFRVMLDDDNTQGIRNSANNGGLTIENLPVLVTEAPEPVEMHDNPTGPDSVENVTTGVTAVETMETDVWYTLQGIRITRPTTAGIYIHNGKKVMVK